MLLEILQISGELLDNSGVIRGLNSSPWSTLLPVAESYVNQVLVDEATDFSPIQLACMAAIANPRVKSFFACGDFNQRLTSWGSRSRDDLIWVFKDIEFREMNIVYRQSRQLNDLAKSMIKLSDGTEQESTLPENVESDGVDPVLHENASVLEVTPWLAERILEIERFTETLPSIAVFVDCEDTVQVVAGSLGDALSPYNIQVVGCPNGQVMGQENDVRVFDVQHIKGLEFEAVFFLRIDKLADSKPDLIDKYLYVGATRAATYLGITCEKNLPTELEPLRSRFSSDWSGF